MKWMSLREIALCMYLLSRILFWWCSVRGIAYLVKRDEIKLNNDVKKRSWTNQEARGRENNEKWPHVTLNSKHSALPWPFCNYSTLICCRRNVWKGIFMNKWLWAEERWVAEINKCQSIRCIFLGQSRLQVIKPRKNRFFCIQFCLVRRLRLEANNELMARREIGNFRPKGPSITIRYEERKKKSLSKQEWEDKNTHGCTVAI